MDNLREIFEEKIEDLNYLPNGWIKTFVPKFKDELFAALGQYVKNFVVLDCKEKYGMFRLYWSLVDMDYNESNELYLIIESIIHKYEKMSYETCMVCGAYTFSRSYELPLCNNCHPYDVI